MRQWLRECRFRVGKDGSGIDFSSLRIVFDVKKNDLLTPNAAVVKVYNASETTAQKVIREFDTMILEAGYKDAIGLIYSGTVIQSLQYREGTDTVLEVIGGDGDLAYNYGVVNTTLSAGASIGDQLTAAGGAVVETIRSAAVVSGTRLPRGKPIFEGWRDTVRRAGKNLGAQIYVDDGVLQVIPHSGYLPGPAVVLSPETGLIESARQTSDGLQFRCLLNPGIRVGRLVRVDARHVIMAHRDTIDMKAAPELSRSGYYRVIECQYLGDTRGEDWYCEITAVGMDMTSGTTKDGG